MALRATTFSVPREMFPRGRGAYGTGETNRLALRRSEVNTRTGGLVSVTDTLIGDDTGEIRLVGWRENSGELDKIKVGDRIRVIGAILNAGRDGKHELTLRKDSLVVTMS